LVVLSFFCPYVHFLSQPPCLVHASFRDWLDDISLFGLHVRLSSFYGKNLVVGFWAGGSLCFFCVFLLCLLGVALGRGLGLSVNPLSESDGFGVFFFFSFFFFLAGLYFLGFFLIFVSSACCFFPLYRRIRKPHVLVGFLAFFFFYWGHIPVDGFLGFSPDVGFFWMVFFRTLTFWNSFFLFLPWRKFVL